MFKIIKKSTKSKARIGVLRTPHGVIHTPFFMPIATKGAVKSLTSDELARLGAEIILSNTYHLLLRPGLDVLQKAGGLHRLMDWDKPILTDSGGFQVFSLAKMRKILPHGVRFQSHIDGRSFLLTPEKALEIQAVIGSDIRLALDVCAPYPCDYKEAKRAVELTTKWARESRKAIEPYSRNGCIKESPPFQGGGRPARHRLRQQPMAGGGWFWGGAGDEVKEHPLFFAIIQGSVYKDLRFESARALVPLDFAGYAVGGLAVGEPVAEMLEVLDYTVPELPEQKPRYLLGVGPPSQIIEAVRRGIDMFDCVIPTREARHGKLYVESDTRGLVRGYTRKAAKFVRVNPRNHPRQSASINITNAGFATDFTPINIKSKLPELQTHTRAYLHHLFRTQEPLAWRLATLNNVEFYLDLMRSIRQAIRGGKL